MTAGPYHDPDILEFESDSKLHNGRTAVRRQDIVAVHEFGPSHYIPYKYTSIDVRGGYGSSRDAASSWQFSTIEPYETVMERIYGPKKAAPAPTPAPLVYRYKVGQRVCGRVPGSPGMRVFYVRAKVSSSLAYELSTTTPRISGSVFLASEEALTEYCA